MVFFIVLRINVTFLEDGYVMDNKPRSRIVLAKMRGETLTNTSSIPYVREETSQERVIDVLLPHRSGRITETRANLELIIDTQVP